MGKDNAHGAGLFQHKFYLLDRESLAIAENNILILARPESKLPGKQKRAIISLVASAIALLDIYNLIHGPGPDSVESMIGDHDRAPGRLDNNDSEGNCGGEGGILDAASSVSGCLPHKNSQKIPENFQKTYKRIKDMLSSFSEVELTEEEWLSSYELYVNTRKSDRPVSDRPVRY